MTGKENAQDIIRMIDDAKEKDLRGFKGTAINPESAQRYSKICDAVEEIDAATGIKDYTILNESDDPCAAVEMRIDPPIYMSEVSGAAKAFAEATALSDSVSIFTEGNTVVIHFVVKDYWRE